MEDFKNMKFKNSWNKEFETVERSYKTKDANGNHVTKTKKETVQVRGGLKASQLENKFSSVVRHMKTNKPKKFSGYWDEQKME